MSKNKGKSYRKENLQATIRKQKECSALALKIVEKLIETDVTEETLLQSIHHINQASFQDIVEERSITNLCGYPTCNSELKDLPKHQYKITRANGSLLVYDITERKKFCSNACFKAAKYLKDQLPSCPLWLIQQKDTESIKLLTGDSKSQGSLGEQINFNFTSQEDVKQNYGLCPSLNKNLQESNESGYIGKLSKEDNKTTCSDNNDNENGVTIDSDNEEYEDAVDSDIKLFKEANEIILTNNVSSDEMLGKDIVVTNTVSDKQTGVETFYDANCVNAIDNVRVDSNKVCNPTSVVTTVVNDTLNVTSALRIDSQLPEENCLPERNEITGNKNIKDSKANKHRRKSKHRSVKKEQSDVSPMLAAVLRTERCIREWISLDTLLFLLGEDKLKSIIEETCGLEKFKNHTQSTMQDPAVYERYLEICKKLNLLELHESKLDSSFKNESPVGPTKPVPDYESLKQQTAEMEIKVRSFYRGDKQVQFNEEGCSADGNEQDSVTIPLVDQHAQKALRRRILLDHLNRVLPDLLRALGLNKYSSTITSEIKRLVETFTLSAHNVMFRPAEWNFVAIVLLKLLSVPNDVLRQILSMERADKYMTLMLMSYEQDSGYLNRLVTWLLYEHTLFIS